MLICTGDTQDLHKQSIMVFFDNIHYRALFLHRIYLKTLSTLENIELNVLVKRIKSLTYQPYFF